MGSGTRTEMDAVDWAFLLSSVGLAVFHVYLMAVTWPDPDEPTFQFALIALVFLTISVTYAAGYWCSLFYLLCAGFAVYLGVLWVLGGMAYPTVGVATGVVATVFIVLAFYLFIRAHR